MEKLALQPLLVILLALPWLKAASQDINNWWSVDCGSESRRYSNYSLTWYPDFGFTMTGSNKQVPKKQPLEEMNTLRFFPNRTAQNCYSAPTTGNYTYNIIRAGFYYGNYDGLSRPPTFDLTINGENWTTVNTSSSMGGKPIYHEAIHLSRGWELSVCLVQTREGEVPFISSLELLMMIDEALYKEMVPYPLSLRTDPNATFHLLTRTNFGGPEVRFGKDDYNDSYNRIWTSGATPSDCENVSTMPNPIEPLENDPPTAVLADSIAAINASDPITLTVDLPLLDGSIPACFIFYFSNPAPQSQPSGIIGVRATQIYINGQIKASITFEWGRSQVVTVYPVDVMGPSINITLAPDPESNLPTMISGMEVFSRHHVQHDEVPPPTSVWPTPNINPPPSASAPLLFVFTYIILALVLHLVLVL